MIKSRLINSINQNYLRLIQLLFDMGLILDYQLIDVNRIAENVYDLSFNGKKQINNILYDTYKSAGSLLKVLREERQYSILIYDKSIIQVEYIVKNESIIKQRMLFLKRSSIVIPPTELMNDEEYEYEEGLPILLRVDFDPTNHVDSVHPMSHFVINNVKNCRIPMKSNLSINRFLQFIFCQFYECNLDIKCEETQNACITQNETNMVHIDWM